MFNKLIILLLAFVTTSLQCQESRPSVVTAYRISREWSPQADVSILDNEDQIVKDPYHQNIKELLTATDPKSAYYSYFKGLIYLGRRQHAKSYASFSKALKDGFPDWRARFYRAKASLQMGKKTKATVDLACVVKDNPSIDFFSLVKHLK
ncbi:MAG: hypothetical protein KDK44_02745 [Chlamydiia bacterium]|nr:hypothetical protein [Chlamydiia bacterium]MCP5509148.1 hypothetical protein [Chlamydiales bacterium]